MKLTKAQLKQHADIATEMHEVARRREIVGPDGEPDEITCTDIVWIALQCHCRRYNYKLHDSHHPSEHEGCEIDLRRYAREFEAELARRARKP